MNREIGTYSRYIQEKIADIHTSLRGLSGHDLNRAPNLPGANSPYVIATHVLGSTRSWVLGIICGQDLRRDRPTEFVAHGTYEDLGVAAHKLSDEIEAGLAALDPAALDDRFTPSRELWGESEPREITPRDGLAHMLEHAGIHLGEIHITRQLLERDQ